MFIKKRSVYATMVLLVISSSIVAQQKSKRLQAMVYTTADGTSLRLTETGTIVFNDLKASDTAATIVIDTTTKYQTLLGIGGALTDASAEVFAKLPPAKQQELLTAYYDPIKGIGYTLARTNMNSCDFSSDSYTYVAENDTALNTFNIAHDEKYRIPLIKQAMAAADGQLTIFLSPWSPPGWMKDNHDMLHGGKLLPQYRQAWANYYAKFIKAYAMQGVPLWGLTVQNEPMSAQTWESCIYTGEDERDFVRDYLGPTLARQGLGNKKIIIWDHNRDFLYSFSNTILNDTAAAKYVWGIGIHWYEGWNGGKMQFNNEKLTAAKFPDKKLLFTEGCNGNFNIKNINKWSNGERYGYSVINDLNNGIVGWTDWNILLDEHGGPNHVGNYCFAPVHANSQTGELTYTPAYYYLGHFSKFIRPGARRVDCILSNNKLLATAFLNTDGKLALVVMNNTDEKISCSLNAYGKTANIISQPHAISTFIIQ